MPRVFETTDRKTGYICSGCERPARGLGVPSLVGDGYQYGTPVTGSDGFARMEDTAASGYYQNTISRLGGHDLLSVE